MFRPEASIIGLGLQALLTGLHNQRQLHRWCNFYGYGIATSSLKGRAETAFCGRQEQFIRAIFNNPD